MPSTDSFQLVAHSWHDFYLLAGGAAATLTGLMFVAVTFGAGLVSAESSASPRAFVDPTFSHFLQVLSTAGLFLIPTMTAPVAGILLLTGMVVRLAGLVWVFKHMRRAHRVHGDIELSDWLISIVLPAVIFVLVGVAGIELLSGAAAGASLNAIAAGTGAVLAVGVRSAWELMIWMATKVPKKHEEPIQALTGAASVE